MVHTQVPTLAFGQRKHVVQALANKVVRKQGLLSLDEVEKKYGLEQDTAWVDNIMKVVNLATTTFVSGLLFEAFRTSETKVLLRPKVVTHLRTLENAKIPRSSLPAALETMCEAALKFQVDCPLRSATKPAGSAEELE